MKIVKAERREPGLLRLLIHSGRLVYQLDVSVAGRNKKLKIKNLDRSSGSDYVAEWKIDGRLVNRKIIKK